MEQQVKITFISFAALQKCFTWQEKGEGELMVWVIKAFENDVADT